MNRLHGLRLVASDSRMHPLTCCVSFVGSRRDDHLTLAAEGPTDRFEVPGIAHNQAGWTGVVRPMGCAARG